MGVGDLDVLLIFGTKFESLHYQGEYREIIEVLSKAPLVARDPTHHIILTYYLYYPTFSYFIVGFKSFCER